MTASTDSAEKLLFHRPRNNFSRYRMRPALQAERDTWKTRQRLEVRWPSHRPSSNVLRFLNLSAPDDGRGLSGHQDCCGYANSTMPVRASNVMEDLQRVSWIQSARFPL